MERKVSITDRRVSGDGHPDCKKVFGYQIHQVQFSQGPDVLWSDCPE